VEEVIEDFPFEMSRLYTQETLNILPLGSYGVLLGMDWLAVHKEKLNFYDKNLECEYVEGNRSVLQGIRNPFSIRQILTLHLKKFSRKGCPLYAIQVLKSVESKDMKGEYHPMLWKFKDVFLKEVPRIPLKRDIDFSIDIVPGVVPTSKLAYRMRTP